MAEIKTFDFEPEGISKIRDQPHGTDWPVVYLLEDVHEMYIGETASLYYRLKQHKDKDKREQLTAVHYITDDDFNKSATMDIESWLIEYISADEKFALQNGNSGMGSHDYYERDRYRAKFETLWEQLQQESMVEKDLVQIKNSDLFKYSPYKTLSEDQLEITQHLFDCITRTSSITTHIIEGEPGTGKTVLATYLVKYLTEQEKTKDTKIGLVVPMTSLRQTLKNVFKHISDLRAGMVIGPGEAVGEDYDLLIVDEAHRLKQRKGITNYGAFDRNNEQLGLGKDGTQLDWILMSSDRQVLFYDEGQSIRPADVEASEFKDITADKHELKNQMRIEGGKEYLRLVDDFFDADPKNDYEIGEYDLQVYSDLKKMVADIKQKDDENGLSRVVAGYAWEWKSKQDPEAYDIEIDDCRLRWNSTMQNWVNSENAVNEVGCIHTVQGYDLNYVGIIVGPELGFNPEKQEFFIREENYYDSKGSQGIDDPEELKRYILNIYKTLFSRGVEGAYIYFCDNEIKKQFKKKL